MFIVPVTRSGTSQWSPCQYKQNSSHNSPTGCFCCICQLLTRKLAGGQETKHKKLRQSHIKDLMEVPRYKTGPSVSLIFQSHWVLLNQRAPSLQRLSVLRATDNPISGQHLSLSLCLGLLKYFSSNLINWKSPSDLCHDIVQSRSRTGSSRASISKFSFVTVNSCLPVLKPGSYQIKSLLYTVICIRYSDSVFCWHYKAN